MLPVQYLASHLNVGNVRVMRDSLLSWSVICISVFHTQLITIIIAFYKDSLKYTLKSKSKGIRVNWEMV